MSADDHEHPRADAVTRPAPGSSRPGAPFLLFGILLCAGLTSCAAADESARAGSAPLEATTPDAAAPRVDPALLDDRAVTSFWVIQDRLAADEDIEEHHWQAYFGTPAMAWLASDEDTRERIRARMRLAFQTDRAPLERELAAAQGSDAVRWRHYARMRDEREALGRYLVQLHASDVMTQALNRAQQHLPPGVVDARSWSVPVRLALFWPDAFAGGGAIYFDLIQARDQGDRLEHLMAHEFHHEYYASLSPLPDLDQQAPRFWLVNSLKQLHQEGLGDRIDKGPPPIAPQRGGTPGYADDYNRHWAEAPQILARFDDALRELAAADDASGDATDGATDDVTGLAREISRLFKLGAHPVGAYMADAVARAEGEQALNVGVGDPFAFLRRFDAARPTFSAEALAFLAEVERELLEETGEQAGRPPGG